MGHKMIFTINADDFGSDERTNAAIVSSFKQRLCSSTTIMANRPGFEDACKLAHDNGLENHIGIHFVLIGGMPLTRHIRKCSRFCNSDGTFKCQRQRVFWLSGYEQDALADELRCQIIKCRANGLKITHADSHKHIHEEWAILSVVMSVCNEQDVPYLRLARNCSSNAVSVAKRGYRHALNCRIRYAHLAGTRYFGSVSDYCNLRRRIGTGQASQSIEIMVHPVYNPGGILVELSSGQALEKMDIEPRLRNQAVSFSGKRYVG